MFKTLFSRNTLCLLVKTHAGNVPSLWKWHVKPFEVHTDAPPNPKTGEIRHSCPNGKTMLAASPPLGRRGAAKLAALYCSVFLPNQGGVSFEHFAHAVRIFHIQHPDIHAWVAGDSPKSAVPAL